MAAIVIALSPSDLPGLSISRIRLKGKRMSGLDDPDYAAFAWRRFRSILRRMAGVALTVAVASVLILWWWLGELPIHMAIATLLGVFGTIMLTAVLMGLMFLSSGSGHDADVEAADLGEDSAAWREEQR
jgi:hypothetical protein